VISTARPGERMGAKTTANVTWRPLQWAGCPSKVGISPSEDHIYIVPGDISFVVKPGAFWIEVRTSCIGGLEATFNVV
jgi:hypothetical protein